MKLSNHLPSLDGMRGIAILLVILTHCGDGWHAAVSIFQETSHVPSFDLPKVLARFVREASHGVQLFFVVSAFTLTLRAAERNDTFLAYACRRIARVGPAYWLAGLFYLAIAGFSPRLWAPQGVHWSDVGIAAAFLSAWQGAASLAVVPGGWSVSCEVAFYILLPTILIVASGRIWILGLLFVLSSVLAAVAMRSASGDDVSQFLSYVYPIQQMPVFFIGILAATICLKYPVKRIPLVPALALLAALLVTPVITYVAPVLPGHILFSVFAAIAVLYAALFPPFFLINGFIVRIGKVSYSMYLVHFAILPQSMKVASQICPTWDIGQLAINFILTSLVAFVVSNATFWLIEQPPMRWTSAMLRRQGYSRPAQKQIPTQSQA